jgi:hypothetical protein
LIEEAQNDGLSPLDVAFRWQFQSVIYLDVTVTYG